ncbi:MAG: hypothetical protein J6O39_02895 [Treponema sp.]|nr:hypothetical protein [Treponema sp.]
MSVAATLLFILICINVILWFVFLARFRKIFSTDEIIARTQNHLNAMLKDINVNASRNLELLEDKIRQVKSVAAETERKIEELKVGLKNASEVRAVEKKLSEGLKKTRSEHRGEGHSENNATLTSRYEKNFQQKELFSEKADGQDASSVRISYAENLIVPKKDFADRVREYKEKGYQPDAIARELECSVQEVRLVLEFGI